MINATDLKNGATFLVNNQPYKVIKYSLVKMGRGGATVRVNARNLLTGTIEDKTFSSNVKVDEVSTVKRKLQYLYQGGGLASFIDPVTFEQIEIPVSILSEELSYIKEGDQVDILFWNKNENGEFKMTALTCDIPPKVVLKVTETPPGVKGNTASNVFKDAILENGMTVKVPLFINNGDEIRIDTRTGSYVERAVLR